MTAGTVFPAFLKLEFANDGSAKGAFLSAVNSTLDSAEKRFTEFSREASKQLDAALSTSRTSTGSLDVGASAQRAAADAARARAVAARELATATATAARENGDFSASTRLAVQALQAQAREEGQAAAAALSHANALEQVQQVLNRQASAVTNLSAATRRNIAVNDNAAVSAGQQRAAYQQLSFQIGDIAQGFALGVSPAVIFAQQAGQTAQAVTLLGGSAKGFAGFLGGPWGAAIIGATTILATLGPKLFETSSAMDAVKFASNGVSDAQGILGNVLDLTTGKVTTQSSALIGLAKAQLLVARVQAQARAADARRGVADIASRPVELSGGLGGGFSAQRREKDARDTISANVLGGTLDSSTAVQRLENLRRVGKITDDQFAAAASSVANLGVELENLKVYGDATKLLDGTGGRSLLKPAKAKAPRKPRSGDGGAAAREEFGEDAKTKIANIADQFSKIPPAVAQANKAVRTLDDIIDDIARKRPLNFEKLIADAKAAKGLINDNLAQPYKDILEQQTRGIEVQRLRVTGREAEAQVLEFQFGIMDKLGVEDREQIESALAKVGIGKAQYQQMLASLGVQRQLTREGQRAAAEQQRQLQFVADTRSNLVQTIAGLRTQGVGALGGFFNRLFDQFNASLSERLVDKIFGNAFVDSETAVTDAHQALAKAGIVAAQSLLDVAQSASQASGANNGAVNDNGAPAVQNQILVLGKKLEDLRNPRDLLGVISRNLAKAVGISDEDAAKIGKAVGANVEGAVYGQIGSSLVLGSRGSKAGAGIGGAFGEAAFKKLAPELFKKLGDFAGPLGSIAGGIIGGALGGLLKKTKTGSATLKIGTDGVGVGSTSGNSKSLKGTASSAGDGIGDALNRIAEQLGGTASGALGVSIGLRNKSFRVDTTGAGRTKGAGVLDFGQDQAAAVKFAIADAIKDGVIQGISAGAQRLIQSGKDIDKQLQKALSLEGALTRVKALTNPVGAALDTLDKEFARLRKIFEEAGASAQENANLEKLYGTERSKAVKDAINSVAGSLRSLYSDLTVGNDALSLRDRRAAAVANYDPLRARVAAGDSTAYDEFSDAARALLEIQRQISGSQGGYFELAGQITALSKSELDRNQAIADTAASRDSPFTNSGIPVRSDAGVVSAIEQQTGQLIDGLGVKLDAMNDNFRTLILQGLAGGGDGGPRYSERGFF